MPANPLTTRAVPNFGTDTTCLTSIQTGRLSSGVQLVAEAAYRRLSTSRGTLFGGDEEANYGFNLEDLIGTLTTPSAAAAVPGQIEAELLKDERINAVQATCVQQTNGPAVAWLITVTAQTDAGPFKLVLSINDVTVELLGLTAGT